MALLGVRKDRQGRPGCLVVNLVQDLVGRW